MLVWWLLRSCTFLFPHPKDFSSDHRWWWFARGETLTPHVIARTHTHTHTPLGTTTEDDKRTDVIWFALDCLCGDCRPGGGGGLRRKGGGIQCWWWNTDARAWNVGCCCCWSLTTRTFLTTDGTAIESFPLIKAKHCCPVLVSNLGPRENRDCTMVASTTVSVFVCVCSLNHIHQL